jgi:hypothetical protein
MLSLFLPRLMGNLAINKQNPMSLAWRCCSTFVKVISSDLSQIFWFILE